MDPLQRFVYAVGRAIGAGAAEFLNTMWPPKRQPAEDMAPDVPRINDGTVPVNPQWRYAKTFGSGLEDAPAAPALDDVDWFDWADGEVREALTGYFHAHCDWMDTVSGIVTERLAADPARAIAALWNVELERTKHDDR